MPQLHLHRFAFVLLITAQIIFVSTSSDVETKEQVGQNSSSLYETLCQQPGSAVRSVKFTFKTLDESTKWYGVLANDISRQYFGSFLKGKQLSRNNPEDYEGMCFTGNKPFAQFGNIGIGTHNAFGKLDRSVYNCMPNGELPGSIKCLDYNIETKFQKTHVAYFMDTEAEDIIVVVDCLPNNEVGWEAASPKPTLTKEEYAAIKNRIVELGFDEENIVSMYDEKCINV